MGRAASSAWLTALAGGSTCRRRVVQRRGGLHLLLLRAKTTCYNMGSAAMYWFHTAEGTAPGGSRLCCVRRDVAIDTPVLPDGGIAFAAGIQRAETNPLLTLVASDAQQTMHCCCCCVPSVPAYLDGGQLRRLQGARGIWQRRQGRQIQLTQLPTSPRLPRHAAAEPCIQRAGLRGTRHTCWCRELKTRGA